MIQLLGIRVRTDEKTGKQLKYDAFFKENWRAPNLHTLFENLDKYIAQIPEHERFNIYYTAAECGEKKREIKIQHVIPFDIDELKITDSPGDSLPFKECDAYIDTVCKSLEIQRSETGIVFSGNGLQFLVQISQPFTSAEFFDTHRIHYKALCNRINYALATGGLPGKADPTVFSAARILRMPGTENRKPGKPRRMATLLQGVMRPLDFDLSKRSGIPAVTPSDQIPKDQLKRYPKADTQTVLEECGFLQQCKKEPQTVSEGAWYAMLSIVGRLEGGSQLAHDFSMGHKGYSHAETEEKLEQALSASGPRTCKNIDTLWDGCTKCPHFEKTTSPITLQGPDYIKTESTGFHDVPFNPKTGQFGKPKPNCEDLRRFFEKAHPYKVLGNSRQVYVWTDKFYEEYEDAYLEHFADIHYSPQSDRNMRGEFKSKVQVNNLTPPKWWVETTARKINFNNGVLDIDTMALTPHSKDLGFRYVLSFDYDPSATCPTFDTFMRQVTCEDRELEQILLEFMGYSLSNDRCWLERALLLLGEGSNGKSTFINVLKGVAGEGNYTPLSIGDLRNEGNRQMLDGKLFNIAEETPDRALTDSSVFKNLVTGGETQVRQIYKKPYSIRNKAKLIFACNDLPRSADTSKGFYRRFLIVPFNAEFSQDKGNRDPFMEEKLLGDLPGVFNRAIAAYKQIKKSRAFTESETVAEALENYQLESDSAHAWIKENLHANGMDPEGPFSVIPELYAEYRQDTEKMGLDPVNAIAFGKKLSGIVPEYKTRKIKRKVKGKAEHVLLGVTRNSNQEF